MKKLFLVLTLASMFIATTAFSATLNMVCDTLVANVGPHVTSEHNFTIDITDNGDGTSIVHGWTDYLSNIFFTSVAGGYDPRDGGPLAALEQIYPNGVYQNASTGFDGDTSAAGTTLWFKGYANSDGPFAGLLFNVGLLGLTYNPDTGMGSMAFGPNTTLAETYYFHENVVPIPGAVWLLLSGLVGIIGLRRRS